MIKTSQAVCIRRMEKSDIEAALNFIIPMLGEVYGNIPDITKRWDLTHMEAAYVEPEDAAMFLAFDSWGKVVGSAASCRYDDRLDKVKGCYDCRVTAEISRCYVDRSQRRLGIGQRLFSALEEYNRNFGYETFCLHTHRFLPGGFPFWVSRKFDILRDDGDALETVYMHKSIVLPAMLAPHLMDGAAEELRV